MLCHGSPSHIMLRQGGETRELRHYHYLNWPQDGLVPMKGGNAHPEPLQHLWRVLHRSQTRRETGGVAHPAMKAAMRLRARSTRPSTRPSETAARTRQTSQSVRQSANAPEADPELKPNRNSKHVYTTVNKLAQGLVLAGTHMASASTDDDNTAGPVTGSSPDPPPSDSFAPLAFQDADAYGIPSNMVTARLEPAMDPSAPPLPIKVMQRTLTNVQPFFSNRQAGADGQAPPSSVIAQEPEPGYRALTDADRPASLAAPALPTRTHAAKMLAQDLHASTKTEVSPYADADEFDSSDAEAGSLYEEPTAWQAPAAHDGSLVETPKRQLVGLRCPPHQVSMLMLVACRWAGTRWW